MIYDSAIEELHVFGLAGDDVFDVTPSTSTEMFFDGGLPNSGLPGDTLTVHALNQTFVNNGTQVLVTGYQAVNYLGMEQTSVALARGTVKKVERWADQVDAFFADLLS